MIVHCKEIIHQNNTKNDKYFLPNIGVSQKIQYFWVSNEFVFVASKYSVRPQAMTLEYLFYCKDVAAAAYTGSS